MVTILSKLIIIDIAFFLIADIKILNSAKRLQKVVFVVKNSPEVCNLLEIKSHQKTICILYHSHNSSINEHEMCGRSMENSK